ncbi:nucleotidyltransferase domain-containing protein [Methylobacterium sp. CM6257]
MQLSDRLAHLPERKQRELGRVARILFAAFQSAQAGKLSEKRRGGRILNPILFGSYARAACVEDHASGYRSDYDLLVVVDGEAFAEGYEPWEQVEARLLQELTATKGLATPVNVIVHCYQDLNDRLGVDEGLLVDPPDPLHRAHVKGVLRPTIAETFVLEFAVRRLTEQGAARRRPWPVWAFAGRATGTVSLPPDQQPVRRMQGRLQGCRPYQPPGRFGHFWPNLLLQCSQ